MDDFLHSSGLGQSEGMTYVVVPAPGSPEILAYLTVDPDLAHFVGEDYDEDYEGYEFSAVTLRRLAVRQNLQNQGMGRSLMKHIIRQCRRVLEEYDIDGLHLIALDEEAKRIYLRMDVGFREFAPNSRHLFLPAASIRTLDL
jgi:GNAT superfamily N-acetyltransferase